MSDPSADRSVKPGAKPGATVALRWPARWAAGLKNIRFGLPLLKKELIELAARRRTYSVRALYAILLFGVFAFMFYSATGRVASSPTAVLGVGRQLLAYIFVAQLIGIYVFLPAMASGAITEEKERGSLDLLFITDLTPTEIVIQKLIGRIVPMLTLLLLSLPLMAVCYSLGGLSAGDVTLSALALVATCVQVGAFSIMISAYSRTSSGALIGTYGYGILVYAAVGIVAGIAGAMLGVFIRPLRWIVWIAAGGLTPAIVTGFGRGNLLMSIGILLAACGWSIVFLRRARRYLVERAFIPPKRKKYSFYGGMIRYTRFEIARLRSRGKGGATSLPDEEPILWRETTNTYLDWPHGFRGTLGFIMFPLVLVALVAALGTRRGVECGWITFLIGTTWIIGAVAVTVRSSRAFASERAHRTLDVLLTTPMTGSEIVRQKMKSSWRLALLFAAPIAALSFIEAWLEMPGFTLASILNAFIYLAATTVSVLVFLPAISWVALLVGMKLRDSRRATLLALGVVVAWNAGPIILVIAALWFTRGGSFSTLLLALPSPAFVVAILESVRVVNPLPMLGVGAGLVLNVAILIWIRRLCLKNADRYLGRPVGSGGDGGESTAALTTEGGAA